MHRPAVAEAAPSPEYKGSVPTRLADHTLPLQGRRYKRETCWTKSTGAALVLLLTFSIIITYNRPFSILHCTAAHNSMRDGPMGHGFGCGDGS